MLSAIKSESIKKYFYLLLYILASTFFFERIPSIETVLGPIRLYNLIIPLIILSFIVLNYSKIIDFNNFIIPRTSLLLFLFLFLGAFGISNVVNFNRFAAAFVATTFCILSCVILSSVKLNPKKLLKLFTILFIAQFIFSAYQFVGDKYLQLPLELTGLKELFKSTVFGIPRVHNTYNEPSYYANALFLAIFLFLFLSVSNINLFGNKIRQYKLIYLVLFVLSVTIFFLTLAKSAWVVLPLPLILALLLIFISIKSKKIKSVFVVSILILGLLGLSATRITSTVVNNITSQFVETVEGTSATSIERAAYSNAALELIPNYLLTGVGPGQFGTYANNNILNNLFPLDQVQPYPYLINKPYYNYKSVIETEKNIVFNVFLEVLLEYGLLAFLVFIFFYIRIIVETITSLYNSNLKLDETNILRLGLLFYIICSLAQFMFISPVYINPFFVACGLLLSLNQFYDPNQN